MAKRKYADSSMASDDSGSEYEVSASEPRKRGRSVTKRRKEPIAVADGHRGLSGNERRHSLSRHSIRSPAVICSALLDWYAGVHETRGMPWRKPYDPSLGQDGRTQRAYEVWVSEIMLQQTQVITVIPYYNKWMERFPTVKDLVSHGLDRDISYPPLSSSSHQSSAKGSTKGPPSVPTASSLFTEYHHLGRFHIETVNGLWKGLGYYSRAARLLQGAQYVMNELGGQIPSSAGDMQRKIPGIGRYSAGAICSIAYNQQVPVLDGNVHRLLCRFLALYTPPKAKSTLDILWSSSTQLVENTEHPGDLNQALIELGSVVCKIREPSCAICPIRPWCQAYQGSQAHPMLKATGIPDIEEVCSLCEPLPEVVAVTTYPMKAKRKAAREELDVVNVVEWRGHRDNDRWFLLVRRPGKGLLAGLYEFPTLPNVTGTLDLDEISYNVLSKLLRKPPCRSSESADNTDSLRVTAMESAGDVVHVFSHIKKTYRPVWVVLKGGGMDPPKLRSETTSPRKTSQEASAAKAKNGIKEHRNAIDEGHEAAASSSTPVPSQMMWVLTKGVTDANVSNGVLKIWTEVKTLWENKTATAPDASC